MSLDILHNIPVNKMAASMFWKTPYWAEAPLKTKMHVEEFIKPECIINIDYFRAPPEVRVKETPPPDRRGIIFKYKNGTKAVITGFAFHKDLPRIRKRKNGLFKNDIKRFWYWWTLSSEGVFKARKWDYIKLDIGDKNAI